MKNLIDQVARQDQQQRETIAQEAKKYFSQDMVAYSFLFSLYFEFLFRESLQLQDQELFFSVFSWQKERSTYLLMLFKEVLMNQGFYISSFCFFFQISLRKDMLKALMDANIDARYIPDCAISAVISQADIVVVGASAVTADGGFVNRVWIIPVYVCFVISIRLAPERLHR